jgi:hypothetical protein
MNNNVKPARKAYSKPLVAVEDFALNQFIASCTIKTGRGNASQQRPGWKNELKAYSPLIYAQIMATNQFITEINCQKLADDDMDTLCYHTSTSPLFTS